MPHLHVCRCEMMTLHMRTALLAIVHLLLCLGLLWALYPTPSGNEIVIESMPMEFKSCGSKTCDSGIRMGVEILACTADPVGPSYSCANTYKPNVVAKATYFRMKTMMSIIGVSNPTSVLLLLEQDGQTIKSYSKEQIHRSFCIGAILPILIFCFLFLAIRKHSFFK
jgi:hypothetical protein